MRYLFARKKAAGGENLEKNPLICKKKRMRYHLSIQKKLCIMNEKSFGCEKS